MRQERAHLYSCTGTVPGIGVLRVSLSVVQLTDLYVCEHNRLVPDTGIKETVGLCVNEAEGAGEEY
jgi:hypothetical protein